MIRRPYLVAAAFVVSTLILFGALARITAMTLALEKSEREALQRATEEENIRIALWRIDATLTELIALENTRPAARFRSASEKAGLQSGPMIRARFEVGPDRKLRAEPKLEAPVWVAALPIPEQPPRARSPKPRPVKAEPETQVAQAAEPPPPETIIWTMQGPENLTTDTALVDQQFDRINVGANESGQQSQYIQPDLNLQAFERRRELGRQSAAAALPVVRTPPPPPGVKVEEVESAFEARWMDDDLVLLRRIRRDDERLLQGVVLDWPALRAFLLERVEAVVPGSRLEAIAEGEEADPGRRLALMPARLVPGPMRETEPKDWMPLRLSIAAAWVAALLGLVGIGSLLKGAMTLSRRRADFVSAVTHELRTPLTTFRLYTEMLAEDMVPAAERPSYLATLKREADRLGHLIENVLAFSRLERRATATRIESVPLSVLLDRSVPRLRERAAQEGLALEIDIYSEQAEERLRMDLASAEQILFNLVDNACKYAPNPAQPALQLTASRRGRFTVIRLHDHGPGIEPRERRRIFRPFHRSAARAAGNAPGVGLGLALSRRLARQMKGDLRLAGSEEGASFELWLRRARTPRT